MATKSKGRALVAMSGGVDSSVAACVLKDQGYEVVGVTMQVWDYSQCEVQEGMGTCCSSEDVEDAREVADHLGIPFYVINCQEEFKKKVINPFMESYMKGQTPLPCTHCNTHLKFDYLVSKMKELQCDYLATGHYARLTQTPTHQWSIVNSTDPWKDQTYFLFTLNPSVVPRLLFPVGDQNKSQVRQYARQRGLPISDKKDSVGLCFVHGSQGYAQFIEEQMGPHFQPRKGVLRHYPTGEVLGSHCGVHHFTYGQRKGLGVFAKNPLYVIQIQEDKGEVWVGEEEHLYSQELKVDQCNFLMDLDQEFLKVKIRYSHPGERAQVIPCSEGGYRVIFDKKQRAVTPGQAAVFYHGPYLVGGGWIQ